MRSRTPQRPPPRPGAVLVWLVLSLGVIIVIVALGTDGGRMMEERRRGQAVADAAASAAAADLFEKYLQNRGTDPDGAAAAIALRVAANNGYTNDGADSVVTVHIPPKSGPFTGLPEHVEVLVEARLRGTFSAAFHGGGMTVRGRAVACGRPRRLGLLFLQPTGPDALIVSGNGALRTTGPILVNSSDPAGYNQSGNSTIEASSHEVVASGVKRSGNGQIVGPIRTGVEPTPDPLRNFPVPDAADYPVRSSSPLSCSDNGSYTLYPGVYKGGISISGNGTVQLLPGVYLRDGGGFQISGNADVTGTGVMLYNGGGANASQVKISGNGAVNLSAPTEGIYQGITIFQERSSTQVVQILGNGDVQLGGTVYAAGAKVQLSGNGSTTGNTLGGAYIARSMQVSVNGSFSIDLGANRPRLPEVRLAE